MEPIQIVAQRYIDLLDDMDVSINYAKNANYISVGHLLWMLKEVRDNTTEMRITRRHRWLGFIVGVMIANGLIDMNTERDAVYKIFIEGE